MPPGSGRRNPGKARQRKDPDMFADLLGKSPMARAAAATLFLGGAVLFPALHLAFHDREHDHVGGGIRFPPALSEKTAVRETPGETAHRHDQGGWHTHELPGAHDGHAPLAALPDPRPADRGDSDPDHGDRSLSHFSIALGEDAAVSIPGGSAPLDVSRADILARHHAPRLGFSFPPPARGPPGR